MLARPPTLRHCFVILNNQSKYKISDTLHVLGYSTLLCSFFYGTMLSCCAAIYPHLKHNLN